MNETKMKLKLFILSYFLISIQIECIPLNNVKHNNLNQLNGSNPLNIASSNGHGGNNSEFNAEVEFFKFINFASYLNPFTSREQLRNALQGNGDSMTCHFCSMGLTLINLYPSVSTVKTIFSVGCSVLRYQESVVCNGLADLFGDEMVYIATNSKLHTSEMCGLFIGPDCMEETNLNHPKWKLPLLPLKMEHSLMLNKIEKSNKDRIKLLDKSTDILHLSDIHLDRYYQSKSMSYCNEPLCCRTASTPTSKSKPAGYWGSLGNCDLAFRMVENLITTVTKDFTNQFHYIILSGDYIAHDVWNTTKDEIIQTTRMLTALLKENLPKDKVMIPVIGNHEGYPVDQFCPSGVGLEKYSIDWLYKELFEQWKQWIPADYHKTFLNYGYYSRVENSLRFIVLNMNYCARLNFWIAIDHLDFGGMLTWLQEELQMALMAKQYVYIVGHIAPDKNECVSHWIDNYISILERYSPIIKGQFFGHTHFDEIRIYYNHSKPINVAYLTPSATTFDNVFPSFRLYQTDNDSKEIIDHHTYYLNITSANMEYKTSFNLLKNLKPKFSYEYSARQAYNMIDLSAQSWHRLAVSLRSNKSLSSKYYKHYGRYNDDEVNKESIIDIDKVVSDIFVY